MKNTFLESFKQSFNVLTMSRVAEKLAFVAFPKIFLEMMRAYFRVEVEGVEYLPRRGKTLIISNHSGCSGLDAVMLGHILNKELHRIPRILALWSYFQLFPMLERPAKKMGLKAASAKNGIDLLKKNHLTVLFPEGVNGSFKPTCDRYQLQFFHTGFLRMALLSGAPIIPSIIIGAEEANINLGSIRLDKYLKGATIPIPFNMFPFPAKWKIQFLPPIDLGELTVKDTNNRLKMQLATARIRARMQSLIDAELQKRNYIYFANPPFLAHSPLFKF